MGNGGINLQRFQALLPLLIRGPKLGGAHIVQPVRQLNDNHPHIPVHGHKHFANVLRLHFLPGRQGDLTQLGYAVHQQRHLRAKLAGDIVNVIGRVFYHIVEQRADDTLIVHAQFKQDFRHRHRVHNIRLPGTAKLPFVGRAGQGIGLFDPGAVILGFLLYFRKERRKPIVIRLMVRRLFRGQLCRCRHRGYCFFILQGLHPLSVFAKWA